MDDALDAVRGFPLSIYCSVSFQALLAHVNQTEVLVASERYQGHHYQYLCERIARWRNIRWKVKRNNWSEMWRGVNPWDFFRGLSITVSFDSFIIALKPVISSSSLIPPLGL
jgi:hypothetical protein